MKRATVLMALAVTLIRCGENWWGVLDMQHAIDAHASDYMMPDVMKIGGVSGWMQATEHSIRQWLSWGTILSGWREEDLFASDRY